MNHNLTTAQTLALSVVDSTPRTAKALRDRLGFHGTRALDNTNAALADLVALGLVVRTLAEVGPSTYTLAAPWTPASDQPSPTAQALTAAHAALDAAELAYHQAEHLGAGPDVLRDLGREADVAAEAVRQAGMAHRAARDAWRAAQTEGRR